MCVLISVLSLSLRRGQKLYKFSMELIVELSIITAS